MKKAILLIFTVALAAFSLQAQAVAEGFHYQGIARDVSGRPLVNLPVTLQVSLRNMEKDGPVYYEERHAVQTDARGFFSVIIGDGQQRKGIFAGLPWAKEDIWMDIALRGQGDTPLHILSSNRLPAVPYAMHAAVTSGLPDAGQDAPIEKNQSIYWTTAGNTLTAPETHFMGTRDNKDLIFKTENTTRINLTKEGQMRIFSGVDGADNEIAAYPLTLEGSNQGIYIKVNGSRNNDNNFVNFGDDEEFTWGAIEGETWDELSSGWEYQLQVALYALNGVALTGGIVAWGAAAAGAFASGLGAGAGAAIVLDLVGLGVDIANLLQESITWGQNIRAEVGVSYSSGAGDYAEWMERAPGVRNLLPGEVVGVTGGKVALSTAKADHYMVVSTFPAVLGNLPKAGDLPKYEKIAFMGQVPVRVLGPVRVGDYLIPSGNHDGFAIAVHPDAMKIGDYTRIIGVAWDSGKADMPFNMIKTAVGINANDLSREVVALEQKVEGIMAYLKGASSSVRPGGPTTAEIFTKATPAPSEKGFSDEEFDRILEYNAPLFEQIMAQAKETLISRGNNLEAHPQLLAFLDNPVPVMKELRRNPAFLAQWAQLDKTLLEKQGK
jgi:hypothetical protein